MHKSNAVNERLADGVSIGYLSPWGCVSDPCPLNSNNFGNNTENGTVGHWASHCKYIVIGGKQNAGYQGI